MAGYAANGMIGDSQAVKMSRLRVDSEIMRERANQLRDEARHMGAIMNGLRDLISSIEIEWHSVESSEFSVWYSKTLRPNLVSGQAAINEFASAIENNAANDENES